MSGRPRLYGSAAEKTAAYRQRQEQRVVVLDRVTHEALHADLVRLMAAVESARAAGDPLALSLDTVTRQDLLLGLADYFERKSLPTQKCVAIPVKAQKGSRRSG